MMRRGISLSRIAERVGYQSDAAFSRAFKKLTGQLPGALRRNALASQRLAA
jgi:AraC-like DNA-binding protein